VQAQDWATFERLRRQAQFLLQARRYKETVELALKAIALFPEDPRPYAQVAYALARQKQSEAPEWALKSGVSIELAPRPPLRGPAGAKHAPARHAPLFEILMSFKGNL